MPRYLLDTNVLIDYGDDPAVQAKLDSAEKSGTIFAIAPSTVTELMVGVVRGGNPCFQKNRRIFNWLQVHSDAILDLPLPFVSRRLGFLIKGSRVEPIHYVTVHRTGGELSDVRRVSEAQG